MPPVGHRVEDEQDVAQGGINDAAVAAGAVGTISAKLRAATTWLSNIAATLAALSPIDITIGGVEPQLDDTDKLAVSLYGDGAAPGDTSLPAHADYGLHVTFVNTLHGPVGDDRATFYAFASNNGDISAFESLNRLYNGATWDRQRNNIEDTLLASLLRSASTNSPVQTNYNHHHMLIYLDITVVAVATTLTLGVQVVDPVSGGYFTVWTAAAAAAGVGDYLYSLAPAAATSLYTEICNLHVGRKWRLVVTHSDGNDITYSAAAIITE